MCCELCRVAAHETAHAAALQAYVNSRPDSAELVDLVAQSAADEAERDAAGDGASHGRPGKRQRIYADHRPLSEIEAGIKRGVLHQVAPQPGFGSRV